MYNPSTKVIGENESRYTLVMVVAKRARQLVAGSPKKSGNGFNKSDFNCA